jgi:hypothetical protein
MPSSDTFVAAKTLGELTMYACVKCAATVLEHDRDSRSPMFYARQAHLDWHAEIQPARTAELQKEKCDE